MEGGPPCPPEWTYDTADTAVRPPNKKGAEEILRAG